ncbi:tRNA lysidine(34) synthetase TilS [Desulfovibrio cuneatus]|uniref:tRNA lysidine(34) synthetase TilS n=1 Tax=Desulfovibrio cuneatus TaxID=159728 RepID=UPI000428CA28|nr:tRNA lysidine(34) synthetase TilS [Desulfovibrio cuneatus]
MPHPADYMPGLPPVPQLPISLQAMPPAAARFCLATARFMEAELGVPLAGTHFLVGFSGGADSLALLTCLHALAPHKGCRVSAAHLNHSLREAAGAEEAWCKATCHAAGIAFYSHTANVPATMQANGMGMEEAARAARYDFYHSSIQASGATFVALGHHLNDLAEDMLMRLVRGAGWPGLSGMAGICATRQLVRPLLHTPRASIETFLHTLKISALMDASNNDTAFTRNRIRHTLLPLVMQENPRFLEHVALLWRQGQGDEAYFAEALHNAGASTAPPPSCVPQPKAQPLFHTTPTAFLAPLPQALRLRWYKQQLQRWGVPPLAATLFRLDTACMGEQFPKTFQFSGGCTATVHKRHIEWCLPAP